MSLKMYQRDIDMLWFGDGNHLEISVLRQKPKTEQNLIMLSSLHKINRVNGKELGGFTILHLQICLIGPMHTGVFLVMTGAPLTISNTLV